MEKEKRIIKCYCHSCQRTTNHDILFSETELSDNDDYWWRYDYYVAKCRGCDEITFLTGITEESEIDYDDEGRPYNPTLYKTYPYQQPIAIGLKNLWPIPTSIATIYKETISALNNKNYLLAAAGYRMVIEAVCLENRIVGKNLELKINNLCKEGIITKHDRDRLHSIRFMGNDSVHMMQASDKDALLLVLDIINTLLNNLYILENRCQRILEGPIKEFADFATLLDKGLKIRKVGEVDILKNLLPHDRRLIREDISKFEKILQNKINDGSYDKLTVCTPPTQGRNQQYKILKTD